MKHRQTIKITLSFSYLYYAAKEEKFSFNKHTT